MTNQQKAFQIFCSETIPKMQKPFSLNGMVYATDNLALIRAEESMIDFVADERKFDDIERKIHKVFLNLNENIDCKTTDFDSYKTEPVYISVGKDVECTECDGEGEVQWSYKSFSMNFDCPKCNGSGLQSKVKKLKTDKMTFPIIPIMFVKIKDNLIQMSSFYKLVEASELLGEKIFLIGLHNGFLFFQVGICQVLLRGSIIKPKYMNVVDYEIIELLS